MDARRQSGVTLIELLVVMVILAILSGYIATVALRVPGKPREKKAQAEMLKLALALDAYQMRFRRYPPDTGYGLSKEDDIPYYTKVIGGAEIPTYDPGSLWRYLLHRVQDNRTGRWYGPYLEEWEQEQMKSYTHTWPDGSTTQSFYLTDPWGNPYGFIGERKRVINNQGSFDLFTAGPDGETACDNNLRDNEEGEDVMYCSDNPQTEDDRDNRAYNTTSEAGQQVEVDDDNDGFPNNVSEFGPEAILNGDVGDDLNNWSPQ